MANVFLFPLDDEETGSDVGAIFDQGCDLETLLPFIGEASPIEHLRNHCPDGKGYLWGVRETEDHIAIWNAMAEDDLVLGCHDRAIVSAAFVLMKIRNPLLAARVWSKRPGEPPGLMCFTSAPYAGKVEMVPQMRIYLDTACSGFTKLDSEKRNNILRDYGSFETFVRLGLGYDFPFSFRHSE